MSALPKAGDFSRARNSQRAVMTDAEIESALVDKMATFFDDPLGFVYYAVDCLNPAAPMSGSASYSHPSETDSKATR